jgi:hypothetical protein
MITLPFFMPFHCFERMELTFPTHFTIVARILLTVA